MSSTRLAPTGSTAKLPEKATAKRRRRSSTPDILTAREISPDVAKDSISGPRVRVLKGSSVQIKPVSWLWADHLARGHLQILSGKPGTGKTSAALSLAATVSSGGRWPDGQSCPPGSVLIWSGEDCLESTLAPRLVACGADLDRVYFVGGVEAGEDSRSFNLASDVELLHAVISEDMAEPPSLIIVEPVVTAVTGDMHHANATRKGLEPLGDIAQRHNACVLGITHVTKGKGGTDPLERILGSQAFGAVPRVVHMVMRYHDAHRDAGRILFARVKSNIGPDGDGFVYDLVQESVVCDHDAQVVGQCVRWGEHLSGSPMELIYEAEGTSDAAQFRGNEARDFLVDTLQHGRMEKAEVVGRAKAQGISQRTLERSYKALGGLPGRPMAFQGKGFWELPEIQTRRVREIGETGQSGSRPSRDGVGGPVGLGETDSIARPPGADDGELLQSRQAPEPGEPGGDTGSRSPATSAGETRNDGAGLLISDDHLKLIQRIAADESMRGRLTTETEVKALLKPDDYKDPEVMSEEGLKRLLRIARRHAH